MLTINYQTILNIVVRFYDKATEDVWIGFHFRNIEDFSSHLPRIADFWQLQLTGKILHKTSLPFKFFEVHEVMPILPGQIDRWVVLFSQTLNEAQARSEISEEEKKFWLEKINHFASKLRAFFIP